MNTLFPALQVHDQPPAKPICVFCEATTDLRQMTRTMHQCGDCVMKAMRWKSIATAPTGVRIPCLALHECDEPLSLAWDRHRRAWVDEFDAVFAPTHWFELPPASEHEP